MQEQMQRLQQQLEASQKVSTSFSTPARTAENSTRPTPSTQAKPTTSKEKPKKQAGKHFVVHQPHQLTIPEFAFNLQNILIKIQTTTCNES